MRRPASAAIAAVIALAIASCGGDEPRAARAKPVATTEPVATFAPLVHLHHDERWWPMSARRFVDYSTLSWANDPCHLNETLAIGGPRRRLAKDEPVPIIDLRRLAGERRPYAHRPYRSDCRGHERRRSYTTAAHTRPYDRGRSSSLTPGEGFYLDLLTDMHNGDPKFATEAGQRLLRGVPAYFERIPERVDGRPGLRIAYWLAYGFQGKPPGRPVARWVEHEGDWERVDVLLRRARGPHRWLPVALFYHVHGSARRVDWADAELATDRADGGATHPVVYSALATHSPYPEPGRHQGRLDTGAATTRGYDKTAACADCPQWRTWKRLRPVRRELWYGYGGAWGTIFDPVVSGPLGPYPGADRPY